MIDHLAFQEAVPVLAKLEQAGYEAYFVGGAVRDLLIGRPVHDVDIATSATPEEVKRLFSHTVDVGIAHGTVMVMEHGTGFEVTTFRTEAAYSDFRRPDDVQFVRSLQDDLQRRDFTINAMAMDQHGRRIDPFGGEQDLHERRIRTVGSAEARFSEDALRMMRAVRFVSQLSFELDKEVEAAIKRHAPLLAHIAVERKRAEIEKLFSGVSRSEAIRLLAVTGLYRFLPGLEEQPQQLVDMANLPLSNLTVPQMWTVLVIVTNKQAVKPFLRKWRLSEKQLTHIARTVQTVHATKEAGTITPQIAYAAGEAALLDAEAVLAVLQRNTPAKTAAAVWEALPIKSRTDLAIGGKELIDWTGKKPGPWVKEILQQIEQSVLAGALDNNDEAIKKWVTACNPQQTL